MTAARHTVARRAQRDGKVANGPAVIRQREPPLAGDPPMAAPE